MKVRVRFAPSPTGFIHLGNLRTALFNYLFARHHGGSFILRVEDTDIERSREEYTQGLFQDLRWMGIQWDEGPETGGDKGPYRQSERLELYRSYAQQLIQKGKAYYCYVTEEETEEMKRTAKAEGRPLRFDNRGRFFSEAEIERRKAAGIRPTVRFMIKEPDLIMHDIIRGTVKFNLDDMVGDFVLLRADGMPTFHLAVCVDDGLMEVTHVIRGEDHLSNTPKHIMLMEAMGFIPPQYGHLSLIHGPGGEPLSKRLESISVRSFRSQGFLPEGLANYIALLGWASGDDREIFTMPELIQAFDLNRVGKSSSNYDPQKLDWVNGQHLHKLSDESFTEKALAFLQSQPLPYEETVLRKVLPIFKTAIERFNQLPGKLEFLAENFQYEKPEILAASSAKEIFYSALEVLPQVTGEDAVLYDRFLALLKPKVMAKGKDLFIPIRLALTGKEHGPELKRLFPALGMERVRLRFDRALRG